MVLRGRYAFAAAPSFIDFMKSERPVAASTTSYIPSTPIAVPLASLIGAFPTRTQLVEDGGFRDDLVARLAGLLALDDVEVGIAALHHPLVVATVLRRLVPPGEPLVEVVRPEQLRHGEPRILGERLVASAEQILRAGLPHDPHIAARRDDLPEVAIELRFELCRRRGSPARGARLHGGIEIRPGGGGDQLVRREDGPQLVCRVVHTTLHYN